MRRGSKPKILFAKTGQVYGVNLSSDFCAEHEWGIPKIRQEFGMIDNIHAKPGIHRRTVLIVPNTLVWVKLGQDQGIAYRPWWHLDNKMPPIEQISKRVANHEELKEYSWSKETRRLRAAWSEDDFAIISSDPEHHRYLRQIFDAFGSFDVAIFLGQRQFLENPGLCIMILSRIPQEILDALKEGDEEGDQLRIKFKATGIEKLLREKGKRYFSLRPRHDENGKLIFWLNPMEQDKNNCGWFTIEDLEDWAEGKGKIPKSNVPVASH